MVLKTKPLEFKGSASLATAESADTTEFARMRNRQQVYKKLFTSVNQVVIEVGMNFYCTSSLLIKPTNT